MKDHFVELYGDLLYDFCESILWSPKTAKVAVRIILKKIHHTKPAHIYHEYERPWVLRIACEELLLLSKKQGRKLSPSEQVMLDANSDISARLKLFDSYFHRLETEEQILLLLRDKYGIPYPEIASTLQATEDSLKNRRQQALHTLEEWIWVNP